MMSVNFSGGTSKMPFGTSFSSSICRRKKSLYLTLYYWRIYSPAKREYD